MNFPRTITHYSFLLLLGICVAAAGQDSKKGSAENEDTPTPAREKSAGAWSGATGKTAAPPAVPVVLAKVQKRTLQKQLWFSGSIISRRRATLAAETPGRLTGIADVGDHFAAGEIIARFDSTLLQKTQAEHQANVAGHRAQIAFLQKEVGRLTTLAKDNNTAISKLEETQALLALEHNALAVNIARSEQTAEKIRRMEVVAPFAGVISRRYVEIGEWIKDGGAVAEIVNLDDLEIKTSVSADVLPYLSLGDTITIAVANQTLRTKLRSIVPVGNDDSRLFELRLEAPPGIGRPQQLVRVAAPISSPRDGLVVPVDALIIRNLGISVFVIGDDMTARRVPVQTGISDRDGFIEVRGMLSAGERVVVRGGERLRNDIQVRAVTLDQLQ